MRNGANGCCISMLRRPSADTTTSFAKRVSDGCFSVAYASGSEGRSRRLRFRLRGAFPSL